MLSVGSAYKRTLAKRVAHVVNATGFLSHLVVRRHIINMCIMYVFVYLKLFL